jgi:hypothetical protein
MEAGRHLAGLASRDKVEDGLGVAAPWPGDVGRCPTVSKAFYTERAWCHDGTLLAPPSIREFFIALSSSWFVRMSGPLSVPLALAAFFRTERNSQNLNGCYFLHLYLDSIIRYLVT